MDFGSFDNIYIYMYIYILKIKIKISFSVKTKAETEKVSWTKCCYFFKFYILCANLRKNG